MSISDAQDMNHQTAEPQTLTWQRAVLILGLIVVAVVGRLVPHPSNFTPMGAIALFAGATLFRRGWAVGIPLLAMLVTDVIIGLKSPYTPFVFDTSLPVVYACLLFNVWLGWQIRTQRRAMPVFGAALLGSVVFFIVTNFACWLAFFPTTAQGLADCYIGAIPFFRNSLLGDLIYTAALFGALAMAEKWFPAVRMGTSGLKTVTGEAVAASLE